MQVSREVVQWLRLALAVKGTSHVSAGLPMQDAMRAWPEGIRPASLSVIAASDGHGNKKHFRSSLGSRIGAQLAIKIMSEWGAKLKDTEVTEHLASAVSKKIAAELHQSWEKRVTQHAACEPFERRRLSKLNEREQKLLRVAPQVAYGATCLSAVVTENWGLLCRLGDGVIAVADEDGNVRLPFNEQEKASQKTASLCNPNAAGEFEHQLINFTIEAPPVFILIASDGLPDAVGGVRKFTGMVQAIGEELKTKGTAEFATWLRSYLDEISHHLFDDTTVAFLIRSDWGANGSTSDE